MLNMQQITQQLQTSIGNVLTLEGLKKAAKEAARLANQLLTGGTGIEKAAAAEKWLLAVIEEYDNKSPVLRQFMDLPLIDRLEAAAVRAAVAWGYSTLELDSTS